MAMLSALLLCWAALKLYAPSTCYPLQQAPSPADVLARDPEEHMQAETKSYTSNYFMEKIFNERVQKNIQGSEGVFTYLENPHKDCFSVLNVKSNMFLCLDSQKTFYASVDDIDENCRFHQVKRHKYYDMLRSCRGDVLVILRRLKANKQTSNSSPLSSNLVIKQYKHTNRRKRRSWHIDPSDPLGCEYPVVRAMNNQRREPAYGGNISKETIAFVEDPFHVLSHGPLSPSLEKMRKKIPRL